VEEAIREEGPEVGRAEAKEAVVQEEVLQEDQEVDPGAVRIEDNMAVAPHRAQIKPLHNVYKSVV
jgi:hypothetical protein